MTNAERIRAMSDEELLEWLIDHACLAGISGNARCKNTKMCRDCWKIWLGWLQSDESKKQGDER